MSGGVVSPGGGVDRPRPRRRVTRRCCRPCRSRARRTCASPRPGRCRPSASEQSVQAPPSRRQSNDEPDSVAVNAKLADALVTVPDGAVRDRRVRRRRVSGDRSRRSSSARPASGRCSLTRRSRGRRRCGCRRRAPSTPCGDVQSAQAPESRRHSKVESSSVEVNEKLAVPFATVPTGPVVIGGVGREQVRQRRQRRRRRSAIRRTARAGAVCSPPACGGRSGFFGFRPSSSSVPSAMPSRSVSRLRGFVCERCSSKPSLSPSRSVSARRGLVLDLRTS